MNCDLDLKRLDTPAPIRALGCNIDKLDHMCATIRDFMVHDMLTDNGHIKAFFGTLCVADAVVCIIGKEYDVGVWSVRFYEESGMFNYVHEFDIRRTRWFRRMIVPMDEILSVTQSVVKISKVRGL